MHDQARQHSQAADEGPRLLVVDDDEELRKLLERYLGEHGYRVSSVADGAEMKAFLARQAADLVILDLMLPGEDGLMLAQHLRQMGDLPILMLSARGEEVDRIIGLEMGADDYLPKPFNPRELQARIKALLRRSQGTQATPEATASAEARYCFEDYVLDLQGHRLQRFTSPETQEEIPITAGEFSLLRVFLENSGKVLSRDDLVQKLKGYERQPYDRSIDVRVTRLRKRIEPDPAHPVYIRTVWGKGYCFTASARSA